MIRRFTPADAQATRAVFFDAVRVGAAEHYSQAELNDWVASPDMPEGWGPWLDGHITFVSETAGRVTGFFMIERDGYLNMAFVLAECRRSGLADRLYAAVLTEARALVLPRMTVWASRLARRFFARHGWLPDPAPPFREGRPVVPEGPDPISAPMYLELTYDDRPA